MNNNPYQEEAKRHWGETAAFKQSVERTKNWKKEDFDWVKKETGQINQELVKVMTLSPSDTAVQTIVERHHRLIEKFYDCLKVMYRQLGEMYVEDKRFRANYDKFASGLAEFLREAIKIYCN